MRILFIMLFFLPLTLPALSLPPVNTWDFVSQKNKAHSWSKNAKYKVIYFLSSSCPCSQDHFNHLNQLVREYPDFEFVGFHSSQYIEKQVAQSYFDKLKINFPIYSDKNLKVADHFKALKTPHVFIYDSSGKMLFGGAPTNSRNIGRANKFYLKVALAELSSGKPLSIKKAKTLGCYIQR